MMKPLQTMLVATGVAAGLAGSIATAQVTGTFESHLNAAKAAAGTEHTELYTRICTQAEARVRAVRPRLPSGTRSLSRCSTTCTSWA